MESKCFIQFGAHQVISSHTLGDPEIRLPCSITVDKDDRQISVSGRKVTFNGARVEETPHWIGEAEIGDPLIRVAVHDAADFDLRPCSDPGSLASRPPQPD